jgi:hypothetical protein
LDACAVAVQRFHDNQVSAHLSAWRVLKKLGTPLPSQNKSREIKNHPNPVPKKLGTPLPPQKKSIEIKNDPKPASQVKNPPVKN